ncbi:MAG TPA: FimV/HubP family polar landmark protein, partial [Solimonas sp.]|nr:FimV/HubP family polar landmark protein [Solimonas sp.]
MSLPHFRKLAIAALLGSSLAVQAASEPYLYGPVRKGEQLARIAWELRPDKTRVGTWQMNAALYRANPRAFANGDMERLLPGKMLVVPTDEDVRRIDPELARRVAREPKKAKTLLAGPLVEATATVAVEAVSAAPAASASASPPPSPSPSPMGAPVKAVLNAETGELRPAPAPGRTVLHAETGELRAVAATTAVSAPAAATPPATPVAPERRRPDADRSPPEPEPGPLPDPNRMTRLAPVAMPDPWKEYEKAPVPDRWRILNSLGVVPQRWWDPYNQNTFKADKPVVGDEGFFSVSLISDTVYEPRRLPTPVGPQSTGNPGQTGIFGGDEQWLLNQNLILALVYLKGDTTFRPPDYEYHITPVFNFNRTVTEEDRAVNIDPRKGAVRNDSFIGMQELFVDYHLRNVSDRFDFDSVRFGIQPFSADFRGFLFQDNQLMARLFGTRDNNRWQYNLGWIRRLEKDTNSGLNSINRPVRNDDTFLANLYRQDWPVLGFTSQALVAHNRNREDGERFYDRNGFLARPASFGTEHPRRYEVTYLGYNGDGHFGRLNLTLSTYLALGNESAGPFIDRQR